MTIQEAAEKVFDASRTTYAEGCPVIGNDVELIGFTETTPKKYSEEELAAMEQSALQAAKEAESRGKCRWVSIICRAARRPAVP